MEVDSSKDVSTMLANAAFAFLNAANQARQSADDCLQGLNDPPINGNPDTVYAMNAKSAAFLAEAAIWTARATTAKAGYLLSGPDENADPGYMHAFKGLIDQCSKAARVKHVSPWDASLAGEQFPAPAAPKPSVSGVSWTNVKSSPIKQGPGGLGPNSGKGAGG